MKQLMTMRNRALPMTAAATAALLNIVLASTPAFGAEDRRRGAEPEGFEETIDMSLDVGRRLAEVTTLMDARDFDAALAALQGLRELPSLNDYEKSRMLQTSAQLHIAMQNYADAIADYEALLQMDNVPETERLATSDIVGQLYLQLQNWQKGIEYLLAVNTQQTGSNMDTLFRIAFAYNQLGNIDEAITYMEQAMVVAGDRASEAYYSNMATLYMAAKNDVRAKATLEELIQKFPDSANLAAHRRNLDILNARL